MIVKERIFSICPECFRDAANEERGSCSCGFKYPNGGIIPYDQDWRFSDELVTELQQYEALRLMGKRLGGAAERLTELDHVSYLYLSRFRDFEFGFLRGFAQLKVLELDYLNLSALRDVELVRGLRVLQLTECRKLNDISAISAAASIKALGLALCNRIVSLSPVSTMVQLEYFSIEANKVDSLEFLRPLENLRQIVISAKVSKPDISSILRVSQLESFAAYRKSIPVEQLTQFKALNPKCEVTLWE